MFAHQYRSLIFTLLLFVAAGLMLATVAWSGGGQDNFSGNRTQAMR